MRNKLINAKIHKVRKRIKSKKKRKLWRVKYLNSFRDFYSKSWE